ncbi:vitamin K-dependent gamma-carboxylase [Macrobrachium rosenbergii]|uniref:vitamin K-dependent gamma-carboxylase n=1 Tax=Macrobrachium rosenbergii TaxID=79674 RepID=UPI0034D3938D
MEKEDAITEDVIIPASSREKRKHSPRNMDSRELPTDSRCRKHHKNMKKFRWPSWVSEILGFRLDQLLTWDDLTRLLYRPCDPASLAATRIMFGILMLLDLPQERGMGIADQLWGDPKLCHFPLFNWIKPFPLRWMLLLYGVMVVCTLLMILGWKWRLSCGVFVTSYWYLFLLDKGTWNNHSYLYGLISTMMLFSDPHRCWSVDSITTPALKNSHVPLWSYTVLRFQVFLLYFFAGLKKLDPDWLYGFSMQHLSEHWVFLPFRLILSNDSIDYYIIHLGGFALDLTIGFFLFLDQTRKVALFFGMAFHLMNSQIFTIGMFPWVCMATMPIFCQMSWPRTLISSAKKVFSSFYYYSKSLLDKIRLKIRFSLHVKVSVHQRNARETGNTDLISGKEDRKALKSSMETKNDCNKKEVLLLLQRNPDCCYEESSTVYGKQKLTTLVVLAYIILQLFLPFSHFITKGYNTWTEGPYGYSWDMMVHSWDTLHIKITAVNKETQHKTYVDPNVWVKNNRWASHVDMAVQLGQCLEDKLTHFGMANFSLHFDVWRSLNRRFQQRVYDPNIDVLEAPWSPWQKTQWVLPILSELSPWRSRLREIQKLYEEISLAANTIFIADFPGMTLENYLSKELRNTTIEVLQGQVTVFLEISHQTCESIHLELISKDPEMNLNIISSMKNIKQENIVGTVKATEINKTNHKRVAHKKLNEGCEVTLRQGQKISLPSESLHQVKTTSDKPSVFMYTFINETLKRGITGMKNNSDSSTAKENAHSIGESNLSASGDEGISKSCQRHRPWFSNPKLIYSKRKSTNWENKETAQDKETASDKQTVSHEFITDVPTWKDLMNFFVWKSKIFTRSGRLLAKALKSVLTGESMNIV